MWGCERMMPHCGQTVVIAAGPCRGDPLWHTAALSPEDEGGMADSTDSHAPRGPFRVWSAFRWSLQGLAFAWRLESSFRLEVYLFLILAPLGFWLGDSGLERAVLVGCLMLVLIVEVLNSALEAVVDRFGAEWHELAGRAKDMGSAAVFLCDINVLLCWGLILLPRLGGGGDA